MCISAVMDDKIAFQLQMIKKKKNTTRDVYHWSQSQILTPWDAKTCGTSESSIYGRPEMRLFPEENTCCTSSECLSGLLRWDALIVIMVHGENVASP